MKKLILMVLLFATPAHAGVYSYACKVNGKTFTLRVIDEETLNWRGKKYQLTYDASAAADGPCAIAGWHAEGNDASFNFCTATKGYASFELDGAFIECDLKR